MTIDGGDVGRAVPLPHGCEAMQRAVLDDRVPLVYVGRFREFGLLVDGGPVVDTIEYCPWCGERLPRSLRDEYFDLLEDLGLEVEDTEVPLELRSDAWWRMRGY